MNNSEKYLTHLKRCGLDIVDRSGDEARADCPWCTKSGKCYYNVMKEACNCFSCNQKGNRFDLLNQLAIVHQEVNRSDHLRALAEARRLPVHAFDGWGIGYLGGYYLLPFRSKTGELYDLGRYKIGSVIYSTPGGKKMLFGAEQLADPQLDGQDIYLCEGPWDTVALTYAIRCAGVKGVALGVPGAQTFNLGWVGYCTNRHVNVMFDSDEAGRQGALKVARMLKSYAKSIKSYSWPEGAPKGYDLNDLVSEAIQP